MTLVEFDITDSACRWPSTLWAKVLCEVEQSPLTRGPSGDLGHEYTVRMREIDFHVTMSMAGVVLDFAPPDEAGRAAIRKYIRSHINANRMWFNDQAIEAFHRGN